MVRSDLVPFKTKNNSSINYRQSGDKKIVREENKKHVYTANINSTYLPSIIVALTAFL
jgi:hypothetical protein